MFFTYDKNVNTSRMNTNKSTPKTTNQETPQYSEEHTLGTYSSEDITFLLSALSPEEIESYYTPTTDKERLIQQGIAHYSDMLSRESEPDERYVKIFQQAVTRFGKRMGEDIACLAQQLSDRVEGPITLLSLVRAGVPVGVLIHRALQQLGRESTHYGISIIRDRGIDANALNHVLTMHEASSVVFVDGWTGKGAISDELESSIATHAHLGIEPRLVTLADPAGRAWLSASCEDWLIPSGILGSTVSGLVSRSVLRKGWQTSTEFHACAQLDYLTSFDLSREFVDTIHAHTLVALAATSDNSATHQSMSKTDAASTDVATQAKAVITGIGTEFSIDNINRIKPGIAEATRAVLRRVPERIIVSSKDEEDLAALVHLATQAGVYIDERGESIAPYRAITIIANRGKLDNNNNG